MGNCWIDFFRLDLLFPRDVITRDESLALSEPLTNEAVHHRTFKMLKKGVHSTVHSIWMIYFITQTFVY